MWASPSSTPAERKVRSILSKIKRGIGGHFLRSSESVIIDGLSKSVYSIENNSALMKVASLKVASNSTIFSIEWVPGTPPALHMHVKLLIDEMEYGHLRSSHVSPSHTGDDFHSCTPIVRFAKNARINSPQRLEILLAEIDGIVWDIIFFSETHASIASVIFDGTSQTLHSSWQ